MFSCPGAAWSQIFWVLVVLTFSGSQRRENDSCGQQMMKKHVKGGIAPSSGRDITWHFFSKSSGTGLSGHVQLTQTAAKLSLRGRV